MTTRQGLGPFIRGDCNGDGLVKGDVSDAIAVLVLHFQGGDVPCRAACDANGNGELDISDPRFLLFHNFRGAAPPPNPFPTCEESIRTGDDRLGCERLVGCQSL